MCQGRPARGTRPGMVDLIINIDDAKRLQLENIYLFQKLAGHATMYADGLIAMARESVRENSPGAVSNGRQVSATLRFFKCLAGYPQGQDTQQAAIPNIRVN